MGNLIIDKKLLNLEKKIRDKNRIVQEIPGLKTTQLRKRLEKKNFGYQASNLDIFLIMVDQELCFL